MSVREGATPVREEGSDATAEEEATIAEPASRAAPEPDGATAPRPKKKSKQKKDKGLGSSRGIETMFRTSYRTHNDLSGLADNKANIMISINGIIISIMIASISPGIDSERWLMIPTAVLLVGCLVSLVFAVLAARPRVTHQEVTIDEVREGRANILFFGNFVQLPVGDFVHGMTELMKNTDGVYLNMVRDLYYLGAVLDRKFRFLRYSYNTFMTGLIAGVGLLLVMYVTEALQ